MPICMILVPSTIYGEQECLFHSVTAVIGSLINCPGKSSHGGKRHGLLPVNFLCSVHNYPCSTQ